MTVMNKLVELLGHLSVIDFTLTTSIRDFGIKIFRQIFDNTSNVETFHFNIHGVGVFFTYMMTMFAIDNNSSLVYQINSIITISTNGVLAVALKLLFRRVRPAGMRLEFYEIFPDSFSFPSVSSACAASLAYHCLYHRQWRNNNLRAVFGFVCSSLLAAFAYISSGKQYVFDTLAGAVLGLAEGWIITNYLSITSPEEAKQFAEGIITAATSRIWKSAYYIAVIGLILWFMTICLLYRQYLNV